ncbi:MAG: zinc ribbon domain-containing protein [Anaerolineae bacterium]|nr:zinc ribbon domain-containing protein [Anaerolineae bacterium]
MVGMGRVTGIIMVVASILICLVAGAFLASGVATHRLSISAALLGLVLALPAVLILGGVGGYIALRGHREAVEFAEVEKEKQVLNMVLTQGQVRISDIALEMNAPRDQVEDWIRDLVGKQLFSGAVNWKDGILYSREASQLKADQKCPNCGAQLELVGKGVVECPYCGTQVFLSS